MTVLEENKNLARRWFEEVWNQGNLVALHELLSEHAIVHDLAVEAGAGQDSQKMFAAFVQKFRTAFPDLRFTIEDLIAEDDRVVVRCSVRGTHRGSTFGMPPTGRTVSVSGISIIRVQNGQLVEGWNSFDFLKLYQQLGVYL